MHVEVTVNGSNGLLRQRWLDQLLDGLPGITSSNEVVDVVAKEIGAGGVVRTYDRLTIVPGQTTRNGKIEQDDGDKLTPAEVRKVLRNFDFDVAAEAGHHSTLESAGLTSYPLGLFDVSTQITAQRRTQATLLAGLGLPADYDLRQYNKEDQKPEISEGAGGEMDRGPGVDSTPPRSAVRKLDGKPLTEHPGPSPLFYIKKVGVNFRVMRDDEVIGDYYELINAQRRMNSEARNIGAPDRETWSIHSNESGSSWAVFRGAEVMAYAEDEVSAKAVMKLLVAKEEAGSEATQ
ncbi:hypothetical protein [Alterisphingorhabdus coralli]|uniref:Uncharacterized protein n=1 Tax=Alterisphingorhabdus coralli TaxID=3071408 RepID=A0AA97I334_9SPHN|nr:hypothetical protein [Parasphingorhabdus sp. SCSIO 66989]WOE76355.1 hypothetical protein RB602_06480 [Parasphingorhabdus sp. SCSIO 66989]